MFLHSGSSPDTEEGTVQVASLRFVRASCPGAARTSALRYDYNSSKNRWQDIAWEVETVTKIASEDASLEQLST